MTSSLATPTPNVAAVPVEVALPEPVANRAQSIPGSILLRWLAGVVRRDGDGYAVIAGNGRTVTVLYGGGRPLASKVSRGADDGGIVEALARLQTDSASGCFVMTYKLPDASGELLSGLFTEPSRRLTVHPPPAEVGLLLDQVDSHEFRGAVVFSAEDSIWAVALVDRGEVFGCYGADDRVLKSSTIDIEPLLGLDDLVVTMHSPRADDAVEAAFGLRRSSPGPLLRDASIDRTEAAMIAMLSRFEHRLSSIDPKSGDGPARLVRGLAEIWSAAADLSDGDEGNVSTESPAHPLLAAHWDRSSGMIDTKLLVANLEMASIPDAWFSGADALLLAIDRTVELQLSWLAMADEVSATTLREALNDLLGQAGQLLKCWREQRGSAAGGRQRTRSHGSQGDV